MSLTHTAVIILNWNNWPDTLACLNSLARLWQYEKISLIVCDNASEDESVARLRAWAGERFAPNNRRELSAAEWDRHSPPTRPFRFTLIHVGANLGFAGGNNRGLRYALQCETFDYLWILNNDTVVAPDSLSHLIRCAETRPEIALFGASVLDLARPDILQCAGGCRYYPWITVFREALNGQAWQSSLTAPAPRLDYIYGASLFLRAEAVRRCGLLNEDYFLFYEELDYARRLARLGHGLAWCRPSRVYHKGSASIGRPGQASRAQRIQANYHENLSTLKYTANFHPRLLWLVLPLRFSLKSLVLLLRRDFYLFPPLWRAYRDFFRDFSSPGIKLQG